MGLQLNPFYGTLCQPFYTIWPLIVITWLSVGIEMLILYRIILYRNLIVRTIADTTLLPDSTKRKLNKKIYDNFEDELTATEIEVSNDQYSYIPPEIIDIIMSMLPQYHDLSRVTYWMGNAETEIPKLYNKLMVVDSLPFIYPIMRVICNFICFIIVLIQYSNWYKENSSSSNWEKYMSFVIALLYVPTLKLRAPMKILSIPFNKLGEMSSRCIYTASIVDATYIGFFITVSIPIFMAGIFIFIPSIVLIIVFGIVVIGSIGFILHCKRARGYNRVHVLCCKYIYVLYDYDSGNVGFLFTSSFMVHCLLATITASTIALYLGTNWTEAYKFGFYGQYCDESDYFSFNKWNRYSWDVQFLVACWFIF